MWEAGIEVNVHYIPVHLQPYYRGLGFTEGQYPVAEKYYACALTLPLYYNLSQRDLEQVCAALEKALISAG